jgi:hypothetical protein
MIYDPVMENKVYSITCLKINIFRFLAVSCAFGFKVCKMCYWDLKKCFLKNIDMGIKKTRIRCWFWICKKSCKQVSAKKLSPRSVQKFSALGLKSASRHFLQTLSSNVQKTVSKTLKHILQICLRIQFCIHIWFWTLIFFQKVKIGVP